MQVLNVCQVNPHPFGMIVLTEEELDQVDGDFVKVGVGIAVGAIGGGVSSWLFQAEVQGRSSVRPWLALSVGYGVLRVA